MKPYEYHPSSSKGNSFCWRSQPGQIDWKSIGPRKFRAPSTKKKGYGINYHLTKKQARA